MNEQSIENEADFRAALKRLSTLIDRDPAAGTPEGDELDLLATFVQAYEAEHYPIGPAL